MIGIAIIAGIVLFAAVVFYVMYVSLVQSKNSVETALSNIDIQLRRRLDTIPNLLRIAQKFMTHEKELISEVTRLRTEALKTPCKENPEKGFKINQKLGEKMGGIMVAVENYPDLKSDSTVEKAMHELSLLEEDIASSRRLYNGEVLSFNNKKDIFPYSIIASFLGLERKPFYEDANKEEIQKSIDASEFLS